MVEKITQLRDWQARIHLQRDDGQQFDMVVRIPAASEADAAALAQPIAVHVADATNTTVDLAGLELVDVDDQPSADELAHTLAERDEQINYWRKVVAALATKLPLLLHITKDEFDAAGTDVIPAPSPTGDGLVFIAPAMAAAVLSDADLPRPDRELPPEAGSYIPVGDTPARRS